MDAYVDDCETQSLLITGQTLSEEYGILVLCRIGMVPPHAFLAFEYETPSGDRIIKRLDFRPDGLVNCIIGRGKITQDDVTDRVLTSLAVGPSWRLKTEEVLQVPGFRSSYKSSGGNENEVRVDDLDTEVYSSAGNSLKPFFSCFGRKVENCMTFSRGFILQHRHDLGITDTKEQMKKMMNLSWVPIQLPSMMVPHYKQNQCRCRND